MYHFALSTEVAAPVERVWRALCDPAEVVRWDTGVTQALDAPADYPRPGQHVRWRYRSRLFPTLHDRPIEADAPRCLHSRLTLGPYEMDETYFLATANAGCRLVLTLDLRVRLPLIGPVVERIYAGPATRRGFQASLASLKRHCESVAS